MAEIMARLQFETPSSFLFLDDFTNAAGVPLNGRTPLIGAAWATVAGDATDFDLEPVNDMLLRAASSDADVNTGRWALAGTGTPAAISAQCDLKASGLDPSTAFAYAGLLARYVDTNNWLMATVNWVTELVGATTTVGLLVRKRVAGTVTTLATVDVPYLPNPEWATMRLVVDAAGRWFVWWGQRGGLQTLVALGQDSVLATGGALATGRYGLYDVNTDASGNPHHFDNFLAFVPTVDAACFASQSLEYRHDGAFRENAAGTQWAEKTVSGSNLLIPCSGAEGRTPRIFIKGTRGDPDTMGDPGIDDLRATLTITERYLSVPGA